VCSRPATPTPSSGGSQKLVRGSSRATAAGRSRPIRGRKPGNPGRAERAARREFEPAS
jgi:hypothetical protein